ncbi:hypothetical protein [Leisingera daeponensis]|uniref:hypothetical protein n=1 Tax=Leisingera daeponensis TaxID=405746 RepID=UPI000405FB48|nr:hypothetical protein [Leisingera daeponensis]
MGLLNCGYVALLLTFAGAASAADSSFRCNLEPISGDAWVPSKIAIDFFDDFNTAQITDAAFGVSVPAKVVKRSGSSYVLSWSLPGLAVLMESGEAEPRFRAVLNMSNLKMSIQSIRLEEGTTLPRGSGSCERVDSLSLLAQYQVYLQ